MRFLSTLPRVPRIIVTAGLLTALALAGTFTLVATARPEVERKIAGDQVERCLARPIGVQVCRWCEPGNRSGSTAEEDDFLLTAHLHQRQQSFSEAGRA